MTRPRLHRLRIYIQSLQIGAALLCLPAVAFGQTQFTNPDGSRSPGVVIQKSTGATTAGPATTADPLPVRGVARQHVNSSVLTRINNSTTYTSASTSSPQAICLFTSVTACAPVTIPISVATTNSGRVTAVRLVKSTTGATAAVFAVLLYTTAPTETAVFDTTVYTPKAADLTAGIFVGYWACGTGTVNGDNSTFDCTAKNAQGTQTFNVADGTLRAVILAAGAYAPGSSEQFYLQVEADTTLP